jgi:hypothetical protein
VGGGAWPFLVRGVICLLYCDNERDFYLVVVLGRNAYRSVVLVFQTLSCCVSIKQLVVAYANGAYYPTPSHAPVQATIQVVREKAITGL